MPESTRRGPVGGVGSRKIPTRKTRATASSTRQASKNWNLQNDTHDDEDPEDEQTREQAEMQDFNISRMTTNGHIEVAKAVNPVCEMAERVGTEVEFFAQKLDEYVGKLSAEEDTPLHLVLDLVDEFKQIAQDAAEKLEKEYRKERAQQLRKEWSERAKVSTQQNALATSTSLKLGGSQSEAKKEKIELQKKWQQEADIWELFRMILETHYTPDEDDSLAWKQERLQELNQKGVNDFTTDQEMMQRFLLTDKVAYERDLIKHWLEQTADHQESDIQGIVEELEVKTGRGKGLWSNGWMHTREQIKHAKRVRTSGWPEPDSRNMPEVLSADKTEKLVTSLDPDAPSRQNRTIEKPDAYHERALWIALWEMVRRGKTWKEISDWCRDRNEGWRAIAIGKGSDPVEVVSNTVLRKTAYTASQTVSDPYEAAIYGLLGGNFEPVAKICRTVDDHIHAFYSASLTRQFDQYLSTVLPGRSALLPQSGPSGELSIEHSNTLREFLAGLRNKDGIKREAVTPMKLIESYVLQNDIRSMINVLGHAISYVDKQRGGKEEMIVRLNEIWNPNSEEMREEDIALDPHALRIASHMGILLDIFEPEELQGQELHAKENVTIAYMQSLRAAGKREAIPVYATRLSKGAYIMSMSRVLEDITDASEQVATLNLLRQYGLDVLFILTEQLGFVLDARIAKDLPGAKAVRLLEPSDEARYPGQRILQDFLPDDLSLDDQAIVASLKWFDIIEGQWRDTFNALSLALRKALIAGRLALALAIVDEYPYDHIATRKSYQVMGRSINPMDLGSVPVDDEPAKWDLLRRQSQTYYELETIVNAIKALADWRNKEADYIRAHPKLTGASPALKEAKDVVVEAMRAVLTGRLLEHPTGKEEAADCAQIRVAYIPELVIAYNTVLHSAGYLISRENLVESMDLSVTVANDENKLSETFTQAGRMRELVQSFAQTSKSMLVLKAEGKKWTGRKGREGKDLGIWEIGPQGSRSGGSHSRQLSIS